jgi:hypothetical protein
VKQVKGSRRLKTSYFLITMKGRRIMKYLSLMLFLCIFLTGCAAGSNFKPTTAEGANCKAQCARDMAICQGSSYTCDRAASTCMAACEELDAIKSKSNKSASL